MTIDDVFDLHNKYTRAIGLHDADIVAVGNVDWNNVQDDDMFEVTDNFDWMYHDTISMRDMITLLVSKGIIEDAR